MSLDKKMSEIPLRESELPKFGGETYIPALETFMFYSPRGEELVAADWNDPEKNTTTIGYLATIDALERLAENFDQGDANALINLKLPQLHAGLKGAEKPPVYAVREQFNGRNASIFKAVLLTGAVAESVLPLVVADYISEVYAEQKYFSEDGPDDAF